MRGLLDSHCHLDDPRYVDLDEVEARRLAARVRVLVPGVRLAAHRALREEALRRGWLFGVGSHPALAEGIPATGPGLRDALRAAAEGASAIGECGLHRPESTPIESQIAVLRAHLEVAHELRLPLILHCVHAHDVLPGVLLGFGRHTGAPVRGVLHSYSGGPALVQIYEAIGLHFSFGGAITWPRARKPVAALRAVRADRLLLESDGPDQRPHDVAARYSEPAMLPSIAAKAAALRAVTFPALLERLDANAAALGW